MILSYTLILATNVLVKTQDHNTDINSGPHQNTISQTDN